MALPSESQNANGLTTVTKIPAGKKLIFVDPTTNEGGIITLENLTKQILENLTSQTFALDQGTKTIISALNELNSKPSYLLAGGDNIAENADLDTYTAVGNYVCRLSSVAVTLKNSPTKNSFSMKVESTDGDMYWLRQTIQDSRQAVIFMRIKQGKGFLWDPWKKIAPQ